MNSASTSVMGIATTGPSLLRHSACSFLFLIGSCMYSSSDATEQKLDHEHSAEPQLQKDEAATAIENSAAQFTFAAPTQIELREGHIDFDRGIVVPPPRDDGRMNLRNDLDHFRKWLESSGVDSTCDNPNEIIGFAGWGMIIVPAVTHGGDPWETFKAEAVANHPYLTKGTGGFPVFWGSFHRLPATYLFRTRDGAKGILQIVDHNAGDGGLTKLRVKLVRQ